MNTKSKYQKQSNKLLKSFFNVVCSTLNYHLMLTISWDLESTDNSNRRLIIRSLYERYEY